MAKDARYFKHDSNARNDHKIKALIRKYGIEGYGRYWIVLENLRESDNHKINDDDLTIEGLSEDFRCEPKETIQFLNDCVEKFKLLSHQEGFYCSMPFIQRMMSLQELREKRQKAGKARAAQFRDKLKDVENWGPPYES